MCSSRPQENQSADRNDGSTARLGFHVRLRIIVIAISGVVGIAAVALIAYPACIRVRAEASARAGGCRNEQADSRGRARSSTALRDDDRVAAFPGYGPSDRIVAEAVYCVGTFAQACLAVERAPEPTRRETCERWREFARWYDSFGQHDAATLCPACPELRR